MKFLILLCSLFLMACTSAEKIPVQVPVEVKVPVMVGCIEKNEIPKPPVFATKTIRGDEGDCELVDILLIERVQQQQYIEALQGELAGCVTPTDT